MITNNEDIDRSCGVSTDFINKLTDFFLVSLVRRLQQTYHGEK